MIRVVQGDLFESGADALVNPCNCVGVSGAGLAKVFAKRFPVEQAEYEQHARDGLLHPGELFTIGRSKPPRFLVYFPTKKHWQNTSNYEDVEAGLFALRAWLMTTPVRSIAIPALGCGLGGLTWSHVRERAERILALASARGRRDITLYEPRP